MALGKLSGYGVKFKQLKEVGAALNNSGLSGEPVEVKVGIKGEDMLQSFLNSIDSVPSGKTKDLPEAVREFYEALPENVFTDSNVTETEASSEVDEEVEAADEVEVEASADDDVTSDCPTFKKGWDPKEEDCQACETDFPDEQRVCKAAVELAAIKKAEKKAKKKTAGTRAGKRSRYGHMPTTMAAFIDDLCYVGGTVPDMIKQVMKVHKRKEKQASSKVITHIAHLKKNCGITFKEKGGVVKAKQKYAEGYNKENTETTV